MYMDTMVADHKKAIALYDAFSKATKHADLKAYADANLPHLRTHLQKAEELARAVGSIAVLK
jgi:putative membrane protein